MYDIYSKDKKKYRGFMLNKKRMEGKGKVKEKSRRMAPDKGKNSEQKTTDNVGDLSPVRSSAAGLRISHEYSVLLYYKD